jgi:hypothetical protein
VRQFWKTGVVLLVVAGLFAYIWFVDRKKEPAGETKKETILTVDKAKAKEISIEATGQDTIRLVKEGTSWKVTSPFEAPADDSAVSSMLTSLEKLEADEVVVEKATDVAQYGLKSPKRKVSVVVEGEAQPRVVEFGDQSPGGSAVYARTPSSPRVFTVATWVEGSFDKKPFDLRDRDLLHIKRDDVRTLEVTGPEGDYALTRTDTGDWSITKPLTTRAGRWAVDGLLGTLENLRMEQVVEEQAKDLGRYGLGRPSRTVHLVLKDGTSRTLEIGDATGKKDEGKYDAREKGSPLVAVIPGAVVKDLEKGMGELRAKKLLEVATYDTQGFDVTTGGTTSTYTKSTTKDKDGFDKTQWKRTSPKAADLETSKVEDALFKLGGVEVQEFLDHPGDAAAYGLDAPLLKVEIKAKTESWVELGKKGDQYFARRNADDSVLKVEPKKAEELVKAFTEL